MAHAPQEILDLELQAQQATLAAASSRKRSLGPTEVLWRQLSNPFDVALGSTIYCRALAAPNVQLRNSYIRYFTRSGDVRRTIDAEVEVTSVKYGVEAAISETGNGQDIEIRFYSGNAPAGSPMGMYQLQSTTTLTQADALLAVETITPSTTVIPANHDVIVIELFTPARNTLLTSFILGSNPDGESAPSFIQSPDCPTAANPTTFENLGFPEADLVLEFVTSGR